MNFLKSLLLLLTYLIVGLVVLVSFEKINLPSWLHSAVPIFIVFILLNIGINKLFRLQAIESYWSLRKLWHILPAVAAGTAIGLSAIGIGLLSGATNINQVEVNVHISFASVLITLLIVGWEELWFRGVILNYCHEHISPVALSIIVGVLFLSVHILNPDINLIKAGPVLFSAGALLTMLYFYYRTIWVPIGVHFGNNYFGSMVETTTPNPFFGRDSYCTAIVLFALFILYASKYRNLQHPQRKR